MNGGGSDMMRMLRKDAYGEIDAGDIKAMYAQFLSDQYTVYPVRSLTQNIGHDGTGEHCGINEKFNVEMWDKATDFVFLDNIQSDERIIKENQKFRAFFKKGIMGRISYYSKVIGIYPYLINIKRIFTQ